MFQYCIQSLGPLFHAFLLKLYIIFHPFFSSEICAGGEQGKDACEGDGGAPLVCQGMTGRWYVVGIVTWGVGCGLPGVPGVYARVDRFKNFINSN
jgi:secreted trypsin-like serine protease